MSRSLFPTLFFITTTLVVSAAEQKQDFLNTHIRVVTLEGGMRYAYTDMAPGHVTRRQLEYRATTSLRLQFQKSGASYIQTRAQTGSFQSAFDATAIGLSRQRSAFNVKSIYVGQKIGSDFELEAGGIEFEYGAGTEATYAANSGWMNGYRFRFNSRNGFWRPMKFSVTTGYIGDFLKPNFFSRATRMGDLNYIQVLAQKPLTDNLEASLEYDSIDGVGLSREALLWKQIPARFFDEAQLETNIRATDYVEVAWAATAKKHFFPRVKAQAGLRYTDIPRDFFVNHNGRAVLLNSSEIGLGKRGALLASAKPMPMLEAGMLVSRRLDTDPLNRRWRALGYVSYDLRDVANLLLK
jgi:hypothetical protein